LYSDHTYYESNTRARVFIQIDNKFQTIE